MPQYDYEYMMGNLHLPDPNGPVFDDLESAIQAALDDPDTGTAKGVWEEPHAEIVAIIFWDIVFVPRKEN